MKSLTKSIAKSLGAVAPRRLLLLGAALALGLTALIPVVALAAPSTAHSAAVCDLSCLKAFGDKQITDRLNDLDSLLAKITALGPDNQSSTPSATTTATASTPKGLLTTDQVNTLTTQIQNEKNALTSLKQKIDADTTTTDARADDKSIMKQYRVYAVFMPLLRHMVWVDLMTNALGKMADLSDKIQTAIAGAPASQQTQLNALFTDLQAKVADAQKQLSNVSTLFAAMTPDAYNTNPSGFKYSTLGPLHKATAAAHKDIKAARDDLHQIAMILKADQTSGSGTPSATSTSATPTGTPGH